jgi:hypothetical protein
MLTNILAVAALTAGALAHGDHEQIPIAGPHKALWYNTLPGDGGTQVSKASSQTSSTNLTSLAGRFRILWYLNFRTIALLSLPRFGRREIRHCIHRYIPPYIPKSHPSRYSS